MSFPNSSRGFGRGSGGGGRGGSGRGNGGFGRGRGGFGRGGSHQPGRVDRKGRVKKYSPYPAAGTDKSLAALAAAHQRGEKPEDAGFTQADQARLLAEAAQKLNAPPKLATME